MSHVKNRLSKSLLSVVLSASLFGGGAAIVLANPAQAKNNFHQKNKSKVKSKKKASNTISQRSGNATAAAVAGDGGAGGAGGAGGNGGPQLCLLFGFCSGNNSMGGAGGAGGAGGSSSASNTGDATSANFNSGSQGNSQSDVTTVGQGNGQ